MTARKTQSWDAFWAEVSGRRTEVIRGVEVRVPSDIPLGYEERLAQLSDLGEGSRLEEFEPLVSPLFGDGVFAQWVEAGMGTLEFLTVITWGMAQAAGKDLTFAEAYAVAASDDPGKAVGANRAARRAATKTASRKPSVSTGGPSKRTSSGSTGSARRTSRA